jgi:hypothetical protein
VFDPDGRIARVRGELEREPAAHGPSGGAIVDCDPRKVEGEVKADNCRATKIADLKIAADFFNGALAAYSANTTCRIAKLSPSYCRLRCEDIFLQLRRPPLFDRAVYCVLEHRTYYGPRFEAGAVFIFGGDHYTPRSDAGLFLFYSLSCQAGLSHMNENSALPPLSSWRMPRIQGVEARSMQKSQRLPHSASFAALDTGHSPSVTGWFLSHICDSPQHSAGRHRIYHPGHIANLTSPGP